MDSEKSLKTQWKTARKAWTPEEIKDKILTDDRWLVRGLLAIYKYQTSIEQQDEQTRDHNGVGFTGYDAQFLSQMVEFYNRYKRLSPKQIHAIRFRRNGKPKLGCYARQLAKIANQEQ